MADLFDFEKYQVPVIEGATEQTTNYVDFTDMYANNGFNISFYHLPSKNSVYFKAFITAFNDTYAPDWAAETVYGRADPIYMFKNTTRRMSLAFKVPAGSAGEAYENLAKVQTLIQFLYPTYVDLNDAECSSNANTISQSPLVRLKVMNLAQNEASLQAAEFGTTSNDVIAMADANEESAASFYENYQSSNDASLGLLGVINNLTVNHNLENPDAGVIEKAQGTVLPKLIEVNLDFSPIHEHTVGWSMDSESGDLSFADGFFPYGAPQLQNIDAAAANAGATSLAEEGTTDLSETDSEQQAAALEETTAAEQAEEETSEAATQCILNNGNGQ